MLTAMGDPGQRLHGLESGADDYMTKPFEPRELSFRKNILDRQPREDTLTPAAGDMPVSEDSLIPLGPHRFDMSRRLLTTAGKRQHLTTAERKLLGCFCDHHDTVLSREQISELLEGQMEGRSIDVAVARLRRKLEPNPGKPVFLLTARGHGWVLEQSMEGAEMKLPFEFPLPRMLFGRILLIILTPLIIVQVVTVLIL